MQHNENNLLLIINSIGEGLIITDQKGLVMQINPVAEKLTGWQQKDAGGRLLSEVFNLIHPEKRLVIVEPLMKAVVSGKASKSPEPATLICLDGTEYRISYSTSPINDQDGTLSGAVVVFQNNTGPIQQHEQLLKSCELDNIALLAGAIAHEFNNLFTTLFGNIQLATIRLAKDHPAYASLVSATNAFNEATSLTQQLISFAKGGDPILEIIDLDLVFQQAIALGIKEQNIKIIKTLQEDLWQIKGDRGQLSQMLSQLFINAVQSMPEGGRLHIEANNIKCGSSDHDPGLSGDFVVITVRDEGSGIPQEELLRVFDPFYTNKPESRGIGLTIAQRIVAKHNGQIRLDSKLGEGTTATIYLPAQTSAEDPCSTDLASNTAEPCDVSGHILVMDDEEMVRNLLKDLLETWGYQVDTAADGEEALEKYITADNCGNPIDVVIMDLSIARGMSGDVAIKKLLDLYPDAKVIVSSGYFSDAVMADFGAYGFKGRLAKPFQVDAMQREVSRVIKL